MAWDRRASPAELSLSRHRLSVDLAGQHHLQEPALPGDVGWSFANDLLLCRKRDCVSETWWMWYDEEGNAIDGTTDPIRAGELWLMAREYPTTALIPDIDCEGDCCAYGQCRFGFKGGPMASLPPGLEDD